MIKFTIYTSDGKAWEILEMDGDDALKSIEAFQLGDEAVMAWSFGETVIHFDRRHIVALCAEPHVLE